MVLKTLNLEPKISNLQKANAIFQINIPEFIKTQSFMNFFFFALKTQYLGIIGLQFRKTVVIFEISTLGPKMSYLGIFRLKF